jgi:alpha-beta hydrolase superfamily lysophospholipase
VIAHDRRGHGRSSQTGDGHDMDHYADDLAAVTSHLDLQNATHVGHSTRKNNVDRILADIALRRAAGSASRFAEPRSAASRRSIARAQVRVPLRCAPNLRIRQETSKRPSALVEDPSSAHCFRSGCLRSF